MSDIQGLLAEILAGARSVAIIGCGSQLRGDDAVGVLIAERLFGISGNVRVFCGNTAPENFTGEIKKLRPDALLIIDAADMKLSVGDAALIRPEDIGGVSFSTHMLPLNIITDYLCRETGCRAYILGIQGASFEFGAGMTPEVAAAVDAVVSALTRILANPG